MGDTVVTALIGGLVTLAGVLVSNSRSQAVIASKVDELSRRVDKHNSLIDRTFALERDMGIVKHDVDALQKMREVSDE